MLGDSPTAVKGTTTAPSRKPQSNTPSIDPNLAQGSPPGHRWRSLGAEGAGQARDTVNQLTIGMAPPLHGGRFLSPAICTARRKTCVICIPILLQAPLAPFDPASSCLTGVA